MRRHDALIPLTHDHHHALAQVRSLRSAAGGGDPERLHQAREFLAFFESETTLHFREEEEVVLPLVIDEPEAQPILAQVMMDHLRINALVSTLQWEAESGSIREETMSKVASALGEHIRFEEKTVFPLVERLLPEETLGRVNLRPRNRG